ncbi:hypothetical protein SLEP1_g5563 [Rubroshorea leprosula]|uniref:Uncharacterized protein n=1 Tax=Rubroshorea leprosula TaxID=152421 RepID=A0AAV5HWP0_9ROSI|nr:hypothetical protein SLEP1_g5563 [Rubroshorea leprosula]
MMMISCSVEFSCFFFFRCLVFEQVSLSLVCCIVLR